MATSAAAPPPTALNSDTSCGIAVIFTVRASVQAEPAADQEADHDDQRGAMVLRPPGRDDQVRRASRPRRRHARRR